MPNQHVIDRIAGIQQMLMGVHASGVAMSASSKGQERQQFIDSFLAHALPPIYRFGTGDATDAQGNRSGQLDVVIEYPFAPTIPVGADKPTRLYLAESVAAVVEVKSDLSSQWAEAKRTAELLNPVRRGFGLSMSIGDPPSAQIPLYIVAYKGWKTRATVEQKLAECPSIAGILIIEGGIYCSSNCSAQGPHGLWALICEIYHEISRLQSAVTNPFSYIATPLPTAATVNASLPAGPAPGYSVSLGDITKGGMGFGQ